MEMVGGNHWLDRSSAVQIFATVQHGDWESMSEIYRPIKTSERLTKGIRVEFCNIDVKGEPVYRTSTDALLATIIFQPLTNRDSEEQHGM